jgi:predicted transcriptional regulator
MRISIPEISEQIYPNDIRNILENKYDVLGPLWVGIQLDWMNDIYVSFKDHEKFMIIIFLINKTLHFYSRNFTKLTFEEFYSKNTVEIEKFTIIEIVKNINIPKESARRKIIELEKAGIIKKTKKKLIVDRSAFPFIKPINSVKRISRFLSLFSEMLSKEKILKNSLTSAELNDVIVKNFTFIWKSYYDMQIPYQLKFKNIFLDLETFHIYGCCVVNQHLFLQNSSHISENRISFLDSIYSANAMQGINAMSISDITGIPRATAVRKLNKLVKMNFLNIDKKKHYRVTKLSINKLSPLQDNVLDLLADFSSKVYNSAIL